jgi:hypothetical protein
MLKSLVVLAVSSMMATSAVAQVQPAAPAAPAKPQTVKKRVCYEAEADSYSRLGQRKICKTVEVPVQPSTASSGQTGQSTAPASGGTSNR